MLKYIELFKHVCPCDTLSVAEMLSNKGTHNQILTVDHRNRLNIKGWFVQFCVQHCVVDHVNIKHAVFQSWFAEQLDGC